MGMAPASFSGPVLRGSRPGAAGHLTMENLPPIHSKFIGSVRMPPENTNGAPAGAVVDLR